MSFNTISSSKNAPRGDDAGERVKAASAIDEPSSQPSKAPVDETSAEPKKSPVGEPTPASPKS